MSTVFHAKGWEGGQLLEGRVVYAIICQECGDEVSIYYLFWRDRKECLLRRKRAL